LVTQKVPLWLTRIAAGADTMVSVFMSFVLAMTLHPEIQRKAQEEIDAVIGRDRLPEMRDRKDLPYVDCIVKEVLRYSIVIMIPRAC
jgi:cytochrome P450